jgi:hypothetical protein
MYKICKVGLLSFLVSIAASAATATFDFTGTSGSFSGSNSLGTCAATNGGYCADGDVFTQNLGGFSLTATAWNIVGSNAATTAELFKSGSSPSYVGLGVCNSVEGTHTTGFSSCTNTLGYLDNSGSLDLILFTFSAPVDPTQITLNAFIHEGTDTQWWYSNLTTLTGQTLSSLGAASGTSSSTTISLPGSQSVRSIIFSTNQTQTNDGVKVTSLSVQSAAVPEPATFGLAGLALAGLGLYRRKITKN